MAGREAPGKFAGLMGIPERVGRRPSSRQLFWIICLAARNQRSEPPMPGPADSGPADDACPSCRLEEGAMRVFDAGRLPIPVGAPPLQAEAAGPINAIVEMYWHRQRQTV